MTDYTYLKDIRENGGDVEKLLAAILATYDDIAGYDGPH